MRKAINEKYTAESKLNIKYNALVLNVSQKAKMQHILDQIEEEGHNPLRSKEKAK